MNIKNCIDYDDPLKIFYKGQSSNLNPVKIVEIRRLLDRNVDVYVWSHHRFMCNNILFHFINNKRLQKRNNSIAMLENG